MGTPILYIAHPWTFNPEKSFINAVAWVYELRLRGLIVFSPILHTHPYWKHLKSIYVDSYLKNEDWLDWDLKIIGGFMNGDGCKYNQRQCKQFHLYLGGGKCYGYPDTCCNCNKGKYINVEREKFDSGVIILLSNTAFEDESVTLQEMLEAFKEQCFDGTSPEWKDFWKSQGCRQEYEFAKSHHIRILELESFLEGKEVDL